MRNIYLLFLLFPVSLLAQTTERLTGSVISSADEWQRAPQDALDDNLTDQGASCYSASLGWLGYDLGEGGESVVTRVEWWPQSNSSSTLALFEGSNDPDFLEAFLLYLAADGGTSKGWNSAEVQVNRPFRYLRYVGPHDQSCAVRGVRFYGYHTQEVPETHQYYQPTNLPLVVINAIGSEEPYDKYNDVRCHISIFHEEGTRRTDCSGTYRYRGNGTLGLEKKPYRFKFDEKRKAPGAPAKAKKWTLLPQHGDKSLLRTALAFDISRRMEMPYTSYLQPVDLVINGEYRGTYDLCDQLEVREGRVELDEMTADDISGEALTGGYFFEMDANRGYDDIGFDSSHGNKFTIKSPDDDVIQDAQIQYLKDHYDTFEGYVYGKRYNKYIDYLDLETFCRFFLINELATNTDTFWETYMYKQRGDDRIYYGPVWDFDLGFDNDQRTHNHMTDRNQWLFEINGNGYGSSCAGDMRNFIKAIVGNANVKQRMAEIWSEYRQSGALTKEVLRDRVDDFAAEREASQALNFTRWPVLNTRIMQNYTARGSWEAEVSYVRKFVGERLDWIDRKLGVSISPIVSIPADPSVTCTSAHDLYGRRCPDCSLPGLYIISGVKVVIRP